MRVRMPVAGLKMTEAVERRTKRTSGMHSVIIIKIEPDERLRDHANNTFDGLFQFFVARTWITVGRFVQARASKHGFAPCPADCTDSFISRHTNRSLAECCC